ncbi:MAG: DUF393 domain-containing protein [Phycisphaerales bacterium]|nr:DUF393 domain-containing protein [Phycisphaerales bacterium]
MTPAFTILIDGECPMCRHEGNLLRRLDKGRGRLTLVDITAPDFDAAAYGTTLQDVMGSIHGVTADGRLLSGMEVFRRAYAAVGLGWLWAPTRWPLLRPAFDWLYRRLAKRRLWLSGRRMVCEGGACRVEPRGRRRSVVRAAREGREGREDGEETRAAPRSTRASTAQA